EVLLHLSSPTPSPTPRPLSPPEVTLIVCDSSISLLPCIYSTFLPLYYRRYELSGQPVFAPAGGLLEWRAAEGAVSGRRPLMHYALTRLWILPPSLAHLGEEAERAPPEGPRSALTSFPLSPRSHSWERKSSTSNSVVELDWNNCLQPPCLS
ncbi:hypothetical protein KUCAC02_009250, partial [Chaenocephalus aceratus]